MNLATADGLAAIIDWIVSAMVLELLGLHILRRMTQRGVSSFASLVSLSAGAALLMSVRAALKQAEPMVVEAWLLVAFLAHCMDMRVRWSQAPRVATREPHSTSTHSRSEVV